MTDSVTAAPNERNTLTVRWEFQTGYLGHAPEDMFEGRCTCGFDDHLDGIVGECPECGTEDVVDADGYLESLNAEPWDRDLGPMSEEGRHILP